MASFQLADRVFLVAALVPTANHFPRGNFVGQLIGDVEKVVVLEKLWVKSFDEIGPSPIPIRENLRAALGPDR